jgi:hypothetical protein
MKEQDIRRIIGEVCDALDRYHAKFGPLAIGVATAMALGCSAGSPAYRGQFTESPNTDSDAAIIVADAITFYGAPDVLGAVVDSFDTTDGDATDGDADADAAIDAGPQMDYAVIFDSQTLQNEGG